MEASSGLFAAYMGLAALVLGGCRWDGVLIGWAVTVMLQLSLGRLRPRRALPPRVLLGGLSAALLAGALQAAEAAFPMDSTFPFLSAGIALLLWRCATGKADGYQGVTALLGMVLLVFCGGLVAFGLPEIQWQENQVRGFLWQDVLKTVGVNGIWWAFPARGTGRAKWESAAAALSLGMSLVTRGILGGALTAALTHPVYAAVETIRIFGALQRMEAVFASGVCISVFSLGALLLGTWRATVEDDGACGRPKLAVAVILAVALGLESVWRLAERMELAPPGRIFWALLPILALGVVLCKNCEKSAKRD